MKRLILFMPGIFILACAEKQSIKEDLHLNSLAEKYVTLGLTIGQYDSDFVDAYYGPDSLKPADIKLSVFPKDSLLLSVNNLLEELKEISPNNSDTNLMRAKWMSNQLRAFGRRIRIFSGEYQSFDEESEELFGVKAPAYPETHYQLLIDSLDKLLPGEGKVQDRFQHLANRFIIPKDKLDKVFKSAISEARKRTNDHYDLPGTESFVLEYVTDKSWSGYNWYKGNYSSTIQINTDIQIFIERAIDVGSHESYPGHHVYNMMLEKNLYRDKGWVEISLYPLFSPQSFIAEGSANYGVELAFPGEEKVRFAKDHLLPLAGLDTLYTDLYFKALAIRGKLNYARNEAGRGLIDGTMNENQAMEWLKKYCLYNDETARKSVSFIKKYRSYTINYNYGMDMVQKYIEKGDSSHDLKKRWQRFGLLLSSPVVPADLLEK